MLCSAFTKGLQLWIITSPGWKPVMTISNTNTLNKPLSYISMYAVLLPSGQGKFLWRPVSWRDARLHSLGGIDGFYGPLKKPFKRSATIKAPCRKFPRKCIIEFLKWLACSRIKLAGTGTGFWTLETFQPLQSSMSATASGETVYLSHLRQIGSQSLILHPSSTPPGTLPP